MRPFLLLASFLALHALACRSGTGPDDEVVDPRNYTWTVDTLAYPESFQTAMRSIWGSSSKDVYVVGHNSQPGPGTMFHFNGTSWSTTGFHAAEGGNVAGPISLHAIHGFAADDIWAAGSHIASNPEPPPNSLHTALLMHYDGREWIEVDITGPGLHDVWGPAPDDLYAVGRDGSVFHYDGQSWQAEHLPDTVNCYSIGGDTEDRFIYGYYVPSGTLGWRYLYHNSGSGWELLDRQDGYTFEFFPRFGTSFFSPEPGTIYSTGGGVFQWAGEGWLEVLPSEYYLSDMHGVTSDNIFVVGQRASAFHWNGVDWQELAIPREKLPEDVRLRGVWTDGREAFICGHDADGHQTYILHGK